MGRELAKPTKPITSIIYCGTPEIAVLPLRTLHQAAIPIDLVVTGEDKRRGRGSRLSPSPVKAAALELGLPVSTDAADILSTDANLGVVVAYGQIIQTTVLEKLPMINLHFSLLPRWRGAAPVERAILGGDTQTGVCIMAVAPKLDTGDIYLQKTVAIDDESTLEGLRATLVDVGSNLLIDGLTSGLPEPTSQVGKTTYAKKIDPSEYELDFSLPAIQLQRLIRLGSAWTMFRGKRLKVLKANVDEIQLEPTKADVGPGDFVDGSIGTGDGRLTLCVVQPAGKKLMDASAWLNGVQPKLGERFG